MASELNFPDEACDPAFEMCREDDVLVRPDSSHLIRLTLIYWLNIFFVPATW